MNFVEEQKNYVKKHCGDLPVSGNMRSMVLTKILGIQSSENLHRQRFR